MAPGFNELQPDQNKVDKKSQQLNHTEEHMQACSNFKYKNHNQQKLMHASWSFKPSISTEDPRIFVLPFLDSDMLG